jgi:predicted RecA/RadA family phage recombinase
MATFVHDGNAVDHTPTADLAAGAVVVEGDLVGVTRTPIAANQLGSLAVAGVFDFAKAAGADTAITAGANCYWKADPGVVSTDSQDGKLIGKCVKAAADADAAVRIKLSQ